MKHKIAAQLYTVREELKKDFPGILRDLKKMGWPAVQISKLHGYEAEEIAAVLKETGLKTAGMHIGVERLQNELEEVLREAELFGTKDIVCPTTPKDQRNPEGYRRLKGFLNELALKLKDQGYRISYHNHAFELETEIEGKNVLQYMLDPMGNNSILAEIDVYWIKKSGQDPLSFIQPYANRMPIIHLKDMTADDREAFAEIGTGRLDFSPLLDWGEQHAVEWYAVEQDQCDGNPMDSLQISFDNLTRLIEQR